MNKKFFLLMACLMMGGLSAFAAKNIPVKQVTAVTEVFGDGQQVTSVVLLCDRKMEGKKLKASSFRVREIVPPEMRQKGRESLTEPVYEDREIARVYAKGEQVVLELVKTYHYLPPFGGGPSGGQRPQGPQSGADAEGRASPGRRIQDHAPAGRDPWLLQRDYQDR